MKRVSLGSVPLREGGSGMSKERCLAGDQGWIARAMYVWCLVRCTLAILMAYMLLIRIYAWLRQGKD